ncbi:PH domain-containing protein [Rubripirellula reticaptiva]|uniref:Bacterial membrane flanked domain protein n=1 Tax=Rubripirellula reticaptiva TaxID=2528013 RepID=A0A5C6FCT5_9BACT|nr:PH domain-containing protein [Rubripirellula reticaptiva]TWU58114.1 Bacterial membrane flanked domain protein [Rubripirellula reticaptiva]
MSDMPPTSDPPPPSDAIHQLSIAKRLAPVSVLFQLMAMGRQSVLPLVVASWSAVNGNWLIALGVIAASTLGLAFVLVRYFTLRYQIADGELIVTEGLLFRKVRNVPVDRIQNVDLVQNLWHRMFQVAEVRVETASGSEPEATLRVLSLVEVDRLRSEIKTQSNRSRATTASATDDPSDAYDTEPESPSHQLVLAIPTPWLIKAGLASNRGLILFGILTGYIAQQNTRWDQQFDRVAQNIPGQAWTLNPWILIPIAIIAALLVIRLLGVGWYILRFSGYRLDRVGEDFQVSCGLLTKVSATVPRRRIQFISIHRTPLMRWMKLSSIRIETAGGAGKQGEDAASTVTRRWFVPVIPDARLAEVLDHIRTGLVINEPTVNWTTASPRAGRRLLRLAILGSILAATIGFLSLGNGGILLGVIVGVAIVAWSRIYLRFLGYHRFNDGVMFRSGAWNRKTSVTFFDRIQTLDIKTSPFDRRWSMGRLSIDTAAAGPADHPIVFPMMDIGQAKSEFAILSKHSANSPMSWD